MSDDTLHFRECEACFRKAPQDAMKRCRDCDAWLHEDCDCTNEDCVANALDRQQERKNGDAFDGGFARNH